MDTWKSGKIANSPIILDSALSQTSQPLRLLKPECAAGYCCRYVADQPAAKAVETKLFLLFGRRAIVADQPAAKAVETICFQFKIKNTIVADQPAANAVETLTAFTILVTDESQTSQPLRLLKPPSVAQLPSVALSQTSQPLRLLKLEPLCVLS